MVERNGEARGRRQAQAEQYVGGQRGDGNKEALAGEAHDGERGLDQRDERRVLRAGHPSEVHHVLACHPAFCGCDR